jgi:Ca2+-binding RTX toxin-like protein
VRYVQNVATPPSSDSFGFSFTDGTNVVTGHSTTINITAPATNLVSTSASELLYGDANDNTFTGGIGNDTLTTGGGTDMLVFGSDVFVEGAEFDGADLVIHVEDNTDFTSYTTTILGHATTGSELSFIQFDFDEDATPEIYTVQTTNLDLSGGGGANNLVVGGAGDDTISGGTTTGYDILIGGGGIDTISSTSSGSTFIDGGDGNDILTSAAGNTTFLVSEGNDIITVASSTDTIEVDHDFYLETAYRVTTNPNPALNLLVNDIYLGFENDQGTETLADDTIANLSLRGVTGSIRPTIEIDLDEDGNEETYTIADTASAAGFATSALVMGDDDDTTATTVTGSDNDDVLIGDINGGDLDGGLGNDMLVVTELNSSTSITINGNTGTADTAIFFALETGVTVDLGSVSDGDGVVNDGTNPNDSIKGVENVIGTDQADNITGDGLSNTLDGGGGNDILIGGDGNDTLIGGSGIDTLIGGGGDDTLVGMIDGSVFGEDFTIADYTYVASANGIYVSMSGTVAGSLEVTGWDNTNETAIADATIGIDTLTGVGRIEGTANDDVFSVDSTYVSAFDTFVVFKGRGGDDQFDGTFNSITGTGNTRVEYTSAAAGVIVDLSMGTAYGSANVAQQDTISIDAAAAGDYGITLPNADGGANITVTYSRNASETSDEIAALLADLINEQAQLGTIDVYASSATNVLTITAIEAGFGTFTTALAGTLAGNMTLTAESTVNVTDDTAGIGWDDIMNVNHVRGSTSADSLFGSDNAAGEESFMGGGGSDYIDGRDGMDRADYIFESAAVMVNLGLETTINSVTYASGTAEQVGGGGDIDTLLNIENIRGSSYNDILIGDANANIITGAGGTDTLTGGAGNDTFFFFSPDDSDSTNGIDTITDFDSDSSDGESDTLDISAVITAAGATSFTLVASNTSFSGGTDGGAEAMLVDGSNASTKILQLDLDADGAADMEIELQNDGAVNLDESDFNTGIGV